MKKRLLVMLSIMFAALVLFGGCGSSGSGTDTYADTYFENGVIYTADARDSVAEALAVRGGKIVFVGSAEDGAVYKNRAAKVVDLEGQFMMPGLIDSHIHSILPSFFDINVSDCTTMDALMGVVTSFIATHPERESYFAFGYNASILEGIEVDKGPRKERLDAICPDKPISILAYAGHELWANTKFFEVNNITKDTVPPKGGTYVKDDVTGELWGTMRDTAMKISEEELYSSETLLRELPKLVALFNAYGYTGFLSVGAGDVLTVPFETYLQLEEQGLLTIKMHGATALAQTDYQDYIAKAVQAREKYNTDLVKMNTVKVFIDGAVDTRTAVLLEPYEGTPNNYGEAGWEQDAINKAFAATNEKGIQLHVHAIGDGAVRMTLDALEYAQKHAPEGDYRNVITHLQLVSEEDKSRFGPLNVNAVVQPFWAYRVWGYTNEAEGTAVGEERVQRFYPTKSLQNGGARITSSSDFPFTADPNPFISMQVGVTRNMPDGAEDQIKYDLPSITDIDDPKQLLGPQERMTIREMIRSYTIDAAYVLFSEKETGSLEVGKAADLTVVDQNLLEIDPLRISHTQVQQTYVNGQLVYSSDD